MTKRNVLVALKHEKRIANYALAVAAGAETTLDSAVVPKLDMLEYDEGFAAVTVPGLRSREQSEDPFDVAALLEIDAAPEAETYIVRGVVEDAALGEFEKAANKNKAVVGVYSDVAIAPQIVCPGSAPVGTDATVERLLCTSRMHSNGMDGRGVLVAVVDTGVNLAYLNSQGKNPTFDAARSWAWRAGLTPGSMPVDHGTMVAFDVAIAAPRCTLLDIALLHPLSAPPSGTIMDALLSDAIRAYRHLLTIMSAPRRPGESRSLVVNNSWGMFHPSWDFAVGHPGNYSDNPNHPFNLIVAALERAGADILFAAGNCGADCPDGRCGGVTGNAIYGANSHQAVTCVAGVDTTKARVGYSTIGPGRLVRQKPDISGYTHFSGSGVYTADGGTSAACPVVAGVVAAARSKRPYDPADAQTHPAAVRNLLASTAEDLGAAGYDFRHGHGVVDGCKLVDRLAPVRVDPLIELCRRYPWICRRYWWQYRRRIASGSSQAFTGTTEANTAAEPSPEELAQLMSQALPEMATGDGGEARSTEELAYVFGYLAGQEPQEEAASPKTGCCHGSEDTK